MAVSTIYVLAVLQVNLTILELTYNPSLVGVTFDSQTIDTKLHTFSQAPAIAGIDENAIKDFLSIVLGGSPVSKMIPGWMILPFDLQSHPLALVNKTLVITSIDKDAMQTISPILARLLIHEYFPTRELKSDPTVLVVGRQEYLAFRQEQINKVEAGIDDEIAGVRAYVEDVTGDISLSKQRIQDIQTGYDSTIAYKNTVYNDCVGAGFSDTETGVFNRYYSDETCTTQVLQLDGTISGFQKNISDWTVHIHEDEGLVSQAQSVMATLQSYIQMADAQKDNTPRELGLFSDPSTIRIVLDTTSSKSIQEYLETLVHESLHYQSYVSQDRKLSTSFFEEGLTEYFSRQVLAQNLGMQVNIGYPLVTKLISQMMKKIPEQEFERIYLTKDESRLEAVLNSAYGSTFYSDTVFYFTALFYAPPADALKTANVIMSRIGGGLLAEKDLVSTDYTQQ